MYVRRTYSEHTQYACQVRARFLAEFACTYVVHTGMAYSSIVFANSLQVGPSLAETENTMYTFNNLMNTIF
jgi:hypothetical protein